MASLEGQVAVVTGGGSGIGQAIAAALAARGVRCVVVGRRADRLAQVAGALQTIAEIRGQVFAVETPDISESLRLLRQFRTLRENTQ